jgi:mannitol-1-/sugar-/sorbitol-6-phosphatase
MHDLVPMASVPYEGETFAAFLFDMDGTLITSIASVERVWSRWLGRFGLDPAIILPEIHGIQTLAAIRSLRIEGIDVQAEADWIAREELADLDGVSEIPGAKRFVEGFPEDRWAIVTSASRPLAEARLAIAGIVPPAAFITAEDIPSGKPAPDCFLEGARRLGVAASDCLVFEDALAGIDAGRAAGAKVCVIEATHSHPIETEFPGIRNYASLRASDAEGRLALVAR